MTKPSTRDKLSAILKNYKIIGNGVLWLVIASLAIQVLFLAYPFIGKELMTIIESKGEINQLFFVFSLGAGYIVLTLLGDFIIKIINDGYKAKFSNELYSKYRKILAGFDIHKVNDLGTGKLISKFEQGVDAEKTVFFNIIDTIVICGIRGVGVLILYLYYDYKLFLIMILVIVSYIGLEYILKGRIEKLGDEEREIYEAKSSSLVRYISEFQTIKVNNKTTQENERFKQIIDPLMKISSKRSLLMNGKEHFLEVFFDVGDKAIICYFGYLALTSGYKLADIYMLSNFIRRFRWPLSHFVNSISTLQYNLTKYVSLQEFLNSPQDIINGEKSFNYKKGEIVFKDVSFSYSPERAIISDFSLHIPAGKTTALVGNSGSGKSTLIKLILRLYDVQKGGVIVDNQNIKDIQIESFYDNVGYLTQEPAVFDGSIYENMMYGYNELRLKAKANKEFDELIIENIRQALEHAKCDFVKHMKDGLNTQIGERGVKLSGGEKQRLAIARIFFKNPHILIFDEPTAALDSISEHHITSTLHELFADKTVIVIAHRLQTVMNADQIIVLDDGKIVQSGRHEDLLGQYGLYKELVDLQSGVVKEG